MSISAMDLNISAECGSVHRILASFNQNILTKVSESTHAMMVTNSMQLADVVQQKTDLDLEQYSVVE